MMNEFICCAYVSKQILYHSSFLHPSRSTLTISHKGRKELHVFFLFSDFCEAQEKNLLNLQCRV